MPRAIMKRPSTRPLDTGGVRSCTTLFSPASTEMYPAPTSTKAIVATQRVGDSP